MIDTPVQTLDGSLENFLLKQLSVTGAPYDTGADPTHGTAMAYTILEAIALASGGSTSAQILPVNVYDSGESTTSWDVALGIQMAVDNGATVLNLSLGGTGDSSVLDSIIQQAIAAGIPVFAAAGNSGGTAPTYPAAYSGVLAVTATQNGQIASYADYGSFVDLAFPGASVIYLNGTAYLVQGTSVSTATRRAWRPETRARWAGLGRRLKPPCRKNSPCRSNNFLTRILRTAANPISF